MGLDAHIMTNLGKKFCQEVTDFIMSNECVPPVGQVRACSTVRPAPQTQLVGRWGNDQLYCRHSASRKATLWRVKP